jgi:predicted NACHT family NTPase
MAAVAPAPVAAQQAYRNRQALLNKVQHFWIEGVLERSLHHQHLLTLGLEDCSEAIAPPWRLSWEGDRPLPKGTELIAVFDHLDTGRTLLLLGEPGAGKTTLLLTLVRELLQRARVDPLQLIPVVFNLSSWRGAPIAVWLVGELNSKYQVPQAIGWQWVEQQQLLLLLDGLDELPAAQRPPCVTALNQFHRDYGPEMVVCSRRDDYAALTERLTFQTALYLQALTPAQVMQYLERLPNLTGLRTLLTREVPQLLPLAQSPLMLNIMIMAFEGAQTPQLQPAQDYRPQLFEAYIQRMLQRRQPTTYDPGQTLHWLQQLARRLQQTSQTVFLIERLQPSWLAPGLPRWSYRLGLLVSFVVISLAIGY